MGGYWIGLGLGLCRHVRRAKSPDNAMRVSAYSPTAAWVAGVFNIFPALSFLGNPRSLQPLPASHRHYRSHEAPGDKAVVYTIAVIVCAVIV
jgi:hypothetical protein